MNVKMIGALLLTFCFQHSMAQSISVNKLSCGTAELTLGMSEKAVTDLLQANGFAESSSLRSGDLKVFYTEEHTCNVQFDKNVLVYVERYWGPPSNDAEAAIETFIDAVQSVTRKSTIEHCEVFSYDTTDPDRHHKYVGTKCNGHNIGIALRHDFKTKMTTFDIDEEIGMRNEQRKAMLRR